MIHTPYSQVNTLLDRLLAEIQTILGGKLAGFYLFGSLVMGDFDPRISDIDLLAVLTGDLDEAEFAALDRMQRGLVAYYPAWNDRIEIIYMSRRALKTFRTQPGIIAVISPGEPFHFKEAGKDWLVNWYIVREHGLTLYGPPPDAFIDPISGAEFVQDVREHALAWGEWIHTAHHRGFQAYAILTLCRALYTIEYGQQTSKTRAATWAAQRFPQWSALIEQALLWRQGLPEDEADTEATLPETQRFVDFVIGQVQS